MAWELARAGLMASGRLRLTIAGDSMAPLLRPGDGVWVKSVEPAELRRGDLVVVRCAGELVTHRLVAVDDRGWRTKGDNHNYLDPPASRDAILGRVVAIERNGARIDLQRCRWRAVNRLLGLVNLWEARCFLVGRWLKGWLLGK